MRLFTGLDLPGDVVANLEELLRRLKPTARIQWSPPANLHVTTKFIGEWPEDRLGELKAALASLPGRDAIRVRIRQVGFFPNPHSPRVFWCGIDAPGLLRTGRGHRFGHSEAGDSQRESAHFRRISRWPASKSGWISSRCGRRLPPCASQEFGSFQAAGFYLYQSTLRPHRFRVH